MPLRRLTGWANGNGEVRLTITCGIDWAETHHDVAMVDGAGKLVAKRRISDDAEGCRRLLELLVEAGRGAVTGPTPSRRRVRRRGGCRRGSGRASGAGWRSR